MSLRFSGYIAVLFVADLGRARDFYEKVMGLELGYADDTSAAFNLDPDTLLLLNHAGADNLLSPGDVDHSAGRGARSVLASRVEDVDAAYEELRSKGVEFIRPPENRSWGLRCAHFKDPEGNVWEIHAALGEP
jgi:catechol 2,3-dioxygenase-like lactoylglutathione lyase family enzyme